MGCCGEYLRSELAPARRRRRATLRHWSPRTGCPTVSGDDDRRGPSSALRRSAERLHLQIALDYSSRDAIANAALPGCGGFRRRTGRSAGSSLARQWAGLVTSTLPHSTGWREAAVRLLLWECAYAELCFVDTLWPTSAAMRCAPRARSSTGVSGASAPFPPWRPRRRVMTSRNHPGQQTETGNEQPASKMAGVRFEPGRRATLAAWWAMGMIILGVVPAVVIALNSPPACRAQAFFDPVPT
jgi:hypothetical protein